MVGVKLKKSGRKKDGEVASDSYGSGKVCPFVSRTRQVFAIASFPRPRNESTNDDDDVDVSWLEVKYRGSRGEALRRNTVPQRFGMRILSSGERLVDYS